MGFFSQSSISSVISSIKPFECHSHHHHRHCHQHIGKLGSAFKLDCMHKPSFKASIGNLLSRKQENGTQLQARANRALATNAGSDEWKNIGQEAQDRKDQLELNGRPRKGSGKGIFNKLLRKMAQSSYDGEMAQLNKIIDLAKKRSGVAT